VDEHLIIGVKFVDELDPFQVWTDLVLFEVRDPNQVFLHVRDEFTERAERAGTETVRVVHAL
jgi:hypothetical protein